MITIKSLFQAMIFLILIYLSILKLNAQDYTNDTINSQVIITNVQEINSSGYLMEINNSQNIKKPLLALKTNLLLDAITALNVEIEVPIKTHWSIAGEWIFPWWLHTKNKPNVKPSRLEILCGTLEARYWFGNRDERPVLNGWFVGLFSGAGLYDLQWKAKGYQGEFFLSAGVSGGYTHKIGKRANNLSIEYSIGVGHFRSHYRKYEAFYFTDDKWHPIRLNNGKYRWTGPVRAKISLVWMINYKSKKGGIK